MEGWPAHWRLFLTPALSPQPGKACKCSSVVMVQEPRRIQPSMAHGVWWPGDPSGSEAKVFKLSVKNTAPAGCVSSLCFFPFHCAGNCPPPRLNCLLENPLETKRKLAQALARAPPSCSWAEPGAAALGSEEEAEGHPVLTGASFPAHLLALAPLPSGSP